jgi:sulfur-carrier protein
MINVRVHTAGPLRTAFGGGDVAVALEDVATVGDLLAALAGQSGEQVARYVTAPSSASPYPWVRVLVNGRDMTILGGLEAAVADGDDVTILTPVAGG